jgi:hypothetical protein
MEEIKKNKTKRLIKNILFILVAAGAAGAGIFTFISKDVHKQLTQVETEKKWIAYSSSDQRFQVQFPKFPIHESKQIEIPNANQSIDYKEMRAETSQIAYSVSYIDFPKKWRLVGSNTLLKKSLAVLIEHETAGQQLLEQTPTRHNGLPALDYLVKRGEEQIQGRLIVSGTTLYRLTTTYLPTLASDIQHTQFVESFQLNA